MTIIARNEADVLEANLRAHRALGVDHFAILDNGSTDGTAEILERWRQAGLAHVQTDPDADTDEVFLEWQTRLAQLAASELEADWVINNDADEFWYPVSGDLRGVFERVPAEANGVLAPRLEFVPRPDGAEPFWRRMTLRERRTRVLPKLAHRASGDVKVGPGSHHVVSRALGVGETAGKPSLRGLRTKPEQPPLIVPAPRIECAIFHVPLRSFPQYRSRLEIGMRIARTRQSRRLAQRIDRVMGAEEAQERWDALVWDDAAAATALERGELVADTRLRELIDATEAPGGADTEPARFASRPAEEDRRLALAELEREAFTGLVHNHAQALGERDAAVNRAAARAERLRRSRAKMLQAREELAKARKRANRSERRTERLERKLDRMASTRWWRMRPRLPRRRSGQSP